MAVSSSSASAKTYSIWLYSSTGGTRVAKVDVPVPLPALILYQGNYYVYSPNVQSRYVQVKPYSPQADLGAAELSALAFPEF